MCRCCQSCWEDLYWNCIEEKFCYDENIANYDPEEDEHYTSSNEKKSNGFLTAEPIENNNAPICRQPARLQRYLSTTSSKIHEDDLRREIQTNVPILAPEILAVFANSQIFQEQQSTKLAAAKSPTQVRFSMDSQASDTMKSREIDSEKLLKRLEVPSLSTSSSSLSVSKSDTLDISTKSIPVIIEEEETEEVILRPKHLSSVSSFDDNNNKQNDNNEPPKIINKNLMNVQQIPYFSFHSASENDIFTISSSTYQQQLSLTPEVPSISYSNLPKNYIETPTVEKYRESVSLYSIQTAGIQNDNDYSMPRYYRKSELYQQRSAEMLPQPPSNSNSTKKLDFDLTASTQSIVTTPKHVEKSKRLKKLRSALPPLHIKSTVRDNKDKETSNIRI
uniref:Protein aael aael006235 aedes aegypti n=1 Tax=Corethrella appendiculata TaxID=1370023 RepID=U5EPF9_9DIPT